MAIEVCLETYGSMAPAITSDSVAALLRLRAIPERQGARKRSAARVDDWDRAVVGAVDRLPFVLVHVLWLVEICGCTYEEAADELSTTPAVVADRLARARQTIRSEILKRSPG